MKLDHEGQVEEPFVASIKFIVLRNFKPINYSLLSIFI